MSTSFEREPFELMGIRYRATDDEANAVLLRLVRMEIYREYYAIDELLGMRGKAPLELGQARALTDRHAELWIALCEATARLVKEEVAG